MRRILLLAAILCLSAVCATAQTAQRRTVRSIGEATVAVAPDQARITFSIETRGSTAQEAASLNATRTAAVISALASALRNEGALRTVGYSIRATYNSQQVLTGYEATNSVEVTLHAVARAGEILDAGTKAGATRVSGFVLGLRDPEPARLQALRQAAAKARARAEAMAIGLGLRLGTILNIEEGGTARVIEVDRSTTGTPTPIETGTVSVTANLVLEMEIL